MRIALKLVEYFQALQGVLWVKRWKQGRYVIEWVAVIETD